MKVLLLKSLFIPNKSFIDVNIDSINSYIEHFKIIKKHGDMIHIVLVGWINLPQQYIKKIKHHIREMSNDIILVNIWDNNHGKTHLLKSLSRLCPSYGEYDYIMYADHDISPLYDNLLSVCGVLGKVINNKKIMMVSYDQHPDNRHGTVVYIKQLTFDNNTFYYGRDNISIASGCFMTLPCTFDMFSELRSQYNYGDEDILIGKLLNKYNVYNVVSGLRVHHPYCADDNYTKWKYNRIKNIVRDIHKYK